MAVFRLGFISVVPTVHAEAATASIRGPLNSGRPRRGDDMGADEIPGATL